MYSYVGPFQTGEKDGVKNIYKQRKTNITGILLHTL